jgi:hypothetical protein
MKRKVGREWIECGPSHVQPSLLSVVLPSRHSSGGLDPMEERQQYGFTFPEPGKRPFQFGWKGNINTHEIPKE